MAGNFNRCLAILDDSSGRIGKVLPFLVTHTGELGSKVAKFTSVIGTCATLSCSVSLLLLFVGGHGSECL